MIQQSVYLHYLSALLDGNKSVCLQIVQNMLSEKSADIKDIYLDIIQKSMYRVGQLWENERISVAEEHVASQITEAVLNLFYPVITSTPRIGKKALITCVDKEFHEIGARVVADYFEYKGWESNFLGANTPKHDLLKFIADKEPDVVGISNNLYLNFVRVLKMVEEVKKFFPEQKIIIGGQAFNEKNINMIEHFEDVKFINSLEGLHAYIEEFSYTES